MTADDRERFAAVLGTLAEVFAETLSPARAEGYFVALSALEIGEVEAAARTCLRTCKFFPKPAELLEVLEGSAEDQAERAWAAVLEAIRRLGAYETVWFQDAATDATVRALWGGWPEACQLKTEELGYRHAEFVKAYRAARRNPQPSRPLPGLLEMDNRARGFLAHVPDPILVGLESPKREAPPLEAPRPSRAAESALRPRRLRAVRAGEQLALESAPDSGRPA